MLEKPLRAIEVLATARRAEARLAEDSDTTYNQEIARRIRKRPPKAVWRRELRGLRIGVH